MKTYTVSVTFSVEALNQAEALTIVQNASDVQNRTLIDARKPQRIELESTGKIAESTR